MKRIVVPAMEKWDEKKEEFVYSKKYVLQLEHSLVSVSKWEAKWKKSFLSTKLTPEETLDYIRFMTITQNVPEEAYENLTMENVEEILSYINDPMTATRFTNQDSKVPRWKIITSEEIYYQMIALGIPFECQKWHLNRLLTLIKICNLKNAPPKKMSKRATAKQYADLNAIRRKQLNTRG